MTTTIRSELRTLERGIRQNSRYSQAPPDVARGDREHKRRLRSFFRLINNMAKKQKTGEEGTVRIRNRIKRLDSVRCADLLANPRNWRQHSEGQKAAMSGILAEVGMVDALLVRETGDGTYEIIDGHMRAGMMPGEMVPVLVLDVTPEEATKILLTFDPIAGMATANAVNLDALLREVEFSDEALQALVSELGEAAGLYDTMAAAPESSSSEVDTDGFDLECTCPKCGFEFNPKA